LSKQQLSWLLPCSQSNHNSFHSNSSSKYAYIFEKWTDEKKLTGIAQIMYYYIQEGVKYGRVYITTKYDSYNKSQIISVAIWNTPYNEKMFTSWRRLQKNYFLNNLIKQIGVTPFSRLLLVDEIYEKVYNQNLNKKKGQFTLFQVGTLPEYQSKGMGSNVLLPILKQSEEMDINCFVMTNVLDSIKFFTRLGFTSQKNIQNQQIGEITCLRRTDEVFIHNN
jgi:hypothetical protein